MRVEKPMERILILAPHSDDEVLGCGGLMAKKILQRCFIHVALASVGDVYFYHSERTVTAEERIQEFGNAMDMLGVRSRSIMFKGIESQLDILPIQQLVSKIDRMLTTMEITDLYIPYPSSHQDHRVVYEAGFAAARPSPNNIKRVFCYEYPAAVWSPWPFEFGGNKYVDIKGFIDLKVKALLCHESQVRDGGHLMSADSVKTFAQLRGREAGMEFAERFKVLRMVE